MTVICDRYLIFKFRFPNNFLLFSLKSSISAIKANTDQHKGNGNKIKINTFPFKFYSDCFVVLIHPLFQ